MAKYRTIKPEFWDDEKIAKLPYPCRLFYIGLWNYADDYGVFINNQTLLKSKIFPYDENLRVSEVKSWIDALVDSRRLVPVSHNGESYYVIRKFRSHQVIDKRFERSILPVDVIESFISQSDSKSCEFKNIPDNSHSENTQSTHCENDGSSGIGIGSVSVSGIGSGIGSNSACACVGENFEDFWNLYQKKVGNKDKLLKKWDNLSESEIKLIFIHVPKYVLSTPDPKFRKNPETYLNNKSWFDEIIESKSNGKYNGSGKSPLSTDDIVGRVEKIVQ